jgi:spermidine synthase
MREYKDLTEIFPNRLEFGNYKIIQGLTYSNAEDTKILNFYNYISNSSKFKVVALYASINGNVECIMSNNILEKLTAQNFINTVNGNVLIFGLGLGLNILPLLEDEEISHITVVDINSEIVDNIGPYIKNHDVNNKLTIINGDAFTYYQQLNERKFDVIYFDIWHFINSSIQSDMETLKELYKNNIKETGQIMYWCEDLFTNGIIN